MKRHVDAACCVCQDYTFTQATCARAPLNFETTGWRLHTSGVAKENFANMQWKTFFFFEEKNTIKKSSFLYKILFEKLFFLGEGTFA